MTDMFEVISTGYFKRKKPDIKGPTMSFFRRLSHAFSPLVMIVVITIQALLVLFMQFTIFMLSAGYVKQESVWVTVFPNSNPPTGCPKEILDGTYSNKPL
nr:hypothetical protein MACL_00001558 [Theileria orientalis]